MPPRTNLFQDVVAIIERHKVRDAVVTESAMLIDRDTGEPREVDVTVTSSTHDGDIVMSIEAADRGLRADVPWVEQQYAKHLALPTNQLVLIAAAGFYKPALRKAAALQVVTITPEDLEDDDHEFAVINRLASPPVTVEPTPAGVELEVRPPLGTEMVGTPPVLLVYFADGTRADLDAIAHTILDRHFERVLTNVSKDLSRTGRRTMSIRDRPPEPLFADARRNDTGEVVRIPVEGVVVDVHVDVELHPEMTMVARLFDTTPTLYGETVIGNAQAIFVATDDDGATQATLRTRERTPDDWELDGVFEFPPPDA